MENEKRLISLDMACSMLDRFFCNAPTHAEKSAILEVKQALLEMATTEVVHGHWKEYSHSALVRWKDGEPVWADRSVFRCSRCDFGTIARHNYCPRCGAKMDVERRTIK